MFIYLELVSLLSAWDLNTYKQIKYANMINSYHLIPIFLGLLESKFRVLQVNDKALKRKTTLKFRYY